MYKKSEIACYNDRQYSKVTLKIKCGSRICVRGGPSQDFADIAQGSRGGKNLYLKMGGQGVGPPRSAPEKSNKKILSNKYIPLDS